MGCSGSTAAQPKPVAAAPEGDYKVTIERADDAKMGLSIVTMTDNTIKINALKEEGLVSDWNKKNEEASPELMVKEGDLILAVNGVFVDVEAMKKEMEQKMFTMTLKRAPPVVTPEPEEAAPAPETTAAAEPAAEPPVNDATTENVAAPEAATETPPEAPLGVEDMQVVSPAEADAANAEAEQDARFCKMGIC